MNKMYKKFFFLFIFYFLGLSPLKGEGQEALYVPLTTESQLIPIATYLEASNHFSSAYWKSLQQVLTFDLEYSAHLQPIEISAENQQISLNSPKIWSLWKNYSSYFALHLHAERDHLQAKLYDIKKQKIISLPSIYLSGHLVKDRLAIHQLFDRIINQIFHISSASLGKILYTVDIGSFTSATRTQVWQADYDGANTKMLFEHSSLLVTPCRVPALDSTLAFVSYKLGQPKIMLSNLKGQCRRMSALGGSQLAPCFDNQGRNICFVCDVEGNPDIYLMPVNLKEDKAEKPKKIFASRRGTQASPSFSPDGKQLALVSSKDGSPRIYLIDIANYLKNSDPDKARLISRKNRENTSPAWSPNGRYIAYSARSAGSRQIWVYDTHNQTEFCLTQETGSHENPCWANDSLHLYYNFEDQEGCHLYMVDLILQKPVKITKHAGCTRFAVFL
jgi:TolB protein